MKRVSLVVALVLLLPMLLCASPYIGLSQGLTSTSVELGYLTRSFEQNVTVSLPLLSALEGEKEVYSYPVVGMNLLYKDMIGTAIALAGGVSLRAGWEYEKSLVLQAGLLVQLSLEAPSVRDILFFEFAYMPASLSWTEGTPSSDRLTQGVREYMRFGYRHAF